MRWPLSSWRSRQATERALWAGIARALVGGRLSDIGAGCESAIGGRYGIVADYVGHGIGSSMHMEPSVAHVGPAGRGPHLRAGMALAIEPMITLGSPEVTILSDDWTVVTIDGSVGRALGALGGADGLGAGRADGSWTAAPRAWPNGVSLIGSVR